MTTSRTYETFDVPVSGGYLRVGRWSAEDPHAPTVLAAHGVTANHRAWSVLAEHAPVNLIAPDLRGRGRSAGLTGPAGMSAHAADLRAVLDHLGIERVGLLGHSMGGFVAAAFAEAHPDRTAGVLLVDGGLPLPPPPPGMTPDQALAATLGPAAERLGMTFADAAAYLDYWREHPALSPAWSPDIEAYLAYDLTGEPPQCRTSVSLDAVRDDSVDLLDGVDAASRATSLPAGTLFLRAPNGMLGEPGGLYSEDLVARNADAFPGVEVRQVDDVNHYTIVMAPRGARIVASALMERLR